MKYPAWFHFCSLSDIVSHCKNSGSRIIIRQHQGTNVATLLRHKKVLNPCITISDEPQTFLLPEALPNYMIASNKSVGRFVPANRVVAPQNYEICCLVHLINLMMIYSAFYACAKQMFTSCIPFSEQIERPTYIPLTRALASFAPSCSELELFTLNCVNKDGGSCAEQTGDHL